MSFYLRSFILSKKYTGYKANFKRLKNYKTEVRIKGCIEKFLADFKASAPLSLYFICRGYIYIYIYILTKTKTQN